MLGFYFFLSQLEIFVMLVAGHFYFARLGGLAWRSLTGRAIV